MHQRTLGDSDLEGSRWATGAMGLSHGYGSETDKPQAIALVRSASCVVASPVQDVAFGDMQIQVSRSEIRHATCVMRCRHLHVCIRGRHERRHTEGAMTQLKGSVREQWGKLTNDDLDEIQGRSEQLVGQNPGALRDCPRRAQRQVDAWTPNAGRV